MGVASSEAGSDEPHGLNPSSHVPLPPSDKVESFNLAFEDCRAEAGRIAGRSLSFDEWSQYMGTEVP